ncbi:hypothetical protein COCNU_04G009170 [Cocos nucifera]|uniref:Uncharacterized protein n=1 Tax=Cocos nucifera TaxID=13894 RepID=A0A8K0I691_COCNU|nr:hypothetical protein COCNU_04G009170 [Cocos nucifera]
MMECGSSNAVVASHSSPLLEVPDPGTIETRNDGPSDLATTSAAYPFLSVRCLSIAAIDLVLLGAHSIAPPLRLVRRCRCLPVVGLFHHGTAGPSIQ